MNREIKFRGKMIDKRRKNGMMHQCVLISDKTQKFCKMRLKFNLKGYVWKRLKNKKCEKCSNTYTYYNCVY